MNVSISLCLVVLDQRPYKIQVLFCFVGPQGFGD